MKLPLGMWLGRQRQSVLAVGLAALLGSTTAMAASVETRYGSVEVPDQAKRVVALNDTALDTALAVGVKPVGTTMARGGSGVPDYLEDQAGKVQLVGTIREVNIEAVLKLHPDLILASYSLSKSMYDTLSQIAPTVAPKATYHDDWRVTVDTYAKALGRQAEVDEQFAKLDQQMADIRSQLPKQGQMVSIVRWNPQGPILMSAELFPGRVLQKMGFKLPPLAYNLSRPHSDTLSLENLSQVDSDYLFLATLNKDGQAALDNAREQPAFNTLQAVKAGHVASVDGQIWSSSNGIIAAQKLLADVKTYLLPQR